MVSARNAPKPAEVSKFPCGVCNKGFGFNSIKCLVCGYWVYQHCPKVMGLLKLNTDFKCKECRGEVPDAPIPDINTVQISMEEV